MTDLRTALTPFTSRGIGVVVDATAIAPRCRVTAYPNGKAAPAVEADTPEEALHLAAVALGWSE